MTRKLVAPVLAAIFLVCSAGGIARADMAPQRFADIPPPKEEPMPALRPSDGTAPAEKAGSEGASTTVDVPAAAKEPPTDWALFVVGAGVVLALIAGIVRGARSARG